MSTQSQDGPEDPKQPKKADPKETNAETKASDDDTKERPVEELTPEEQLARYEESLKNDDWGHQPC